MNDQDVYNAILQRNLAYYGIDTAKQLRKAGLQAAKQITDFLQSKNCNEVSIVISDNYYAKYALAIAIGLDTLKFPTRIYCLTRVNKLRDQTAQLFFSEISELSAKYLKTYLDYKSEDIKAGDAFVIALGEPGSTPSLRERESIKRITHFNPVKINIEYPIKGFNWDLSLSFDYAKTDDAKVINTGINTNMLGVGPGELEAVVLPNQKTHLNKNCRLAVLTNTPESYKQDKTKFASLEIIKSELNLGSVLEKLKAANVVLLDLENFYVDLILKAYTELQQTFTRIEIKIDDKYLTLLLPTENKNVYQVSGSKGVVTVKGNELFTNIPKTARFNTSKSALALSLDIAALAKHNHSWLACIGGCVW